MIKLVVKRNRYNTKQISQENYQLQVLGGFLNKLDYLSKESSLCVQRNHPFVVARREATLGDPSHLCGCSTVLLRLRMQADPSFLLPA